MIRTLFDKPCLLSVAASKMPPALPPDHELSQDQLCAIQEEADAVLTKATERHNFYSDMVNRDAVTDIPALLEQCDALHSQTYPLQEAWAKFYTDIGFVFDSAGHFAGSESDDLNDCSDDDEQK